MPITEQGVLSDQDYLALDNEPPSILETAEFISYGGVRLPKCLESNSPFVPNREAYADFIDDDFTLNLQMQIAVSFHQGLPIIIEGGTSIGKTTIVKEMAAKLGWEVHYINLNGATGVEDLMGRYVPNPNKRNSDDPEFIFADGKVTSALRSEPGKIKVIILDEFNAGRPDILIRLHEVLDAYQRQEPVVLSEGASELIPTDKACLKIIALMNPPGKGYFGRAPLDPAQLRRWVYVKAATELPLANFSSSVDAVFGLSSGDKNQKSRTLLRSREVALPHQELKNIPGIEVILKKYKDFHQKAKKLVQSRNIAADQPQPFTFDDRVDPQRVMHFILAFYQGDINATFQDALRYYYSNKLESDIDRAKLDELIQHVEYIPVVSSSQRKVLNQDTSRKPESTPDVLMPNVQEEEQKWQELLGTAVEVKLLPRSITPEVVSNLEAFGFQIVYLPQLELGTLEDLKTQGVHAFLETLQGRYPNWRPYKSLIGLERYHHNKPRNLQEEYWEQVREENVPFPKLPGQWIAVEKLPKPSAGKTYATTALSTKLGLSDRFNIPWNTIHTTLNSHKVSLLAHLGLKKDCDVRMLEILEYNLLANRYGWGKTNSYEWSNTPCVRMGTEHRLLAGASTSGGAATYLPYPPKASLGSFGFRIGIMGLEGLERW